MIKEVGEKSIYNLGKRKCWYKLKSFENSMNDTLDLVLMGGYFGSGKMKNCLSSFLLGVLDENEFVKPISKVGTGFSLEFLQ